MVDDTNADQSTYVTVPHASKNRPPAWFIIFIVALLISIPVFIGITLAARKGEAPSLSGSTNPAQNSDAQVPQFTEKDFIRGWYWGTEEKPLSMPDGYIYTLIGTKGCWHLPAVMCNQE